MRTVVIQAEGPDHVASQAVVTARNVSRRYGDYVRLAALLGLRAGELTALQVGDVDLTLGVVTIRRAFSAGELQTPKSRRTPGPRRGRIGTGPVPDDQRSEAFRGSAGAVGRSAVSLELPYEGAVARVGWPTWLAGQGCWFWGVTGTEARWLSPWGQ